MVKHARCHTHTCSTSTYISVFITHFYNLPEENPAILRNLYIENDLSSYEISDLTENDWSRIAINNSLLKLNIKKEKLKGSRLKYGEKLQNGMRVPHLSEQKIIQTMISMKRSGSSYRTITEYLNNNNVPTKYKKAWCKTTIQTILDREMPEKIKRRKE